MALNKINLSALRCNRIPRLIHPPGRRDEALSPSNTLLVSRRHLFGMAAIAGIGLSPTLRAVEHALASTRVEFDFEGTEERVAFSQNGQERWVIDTHFFGGQPQLTWTKTDDCITLQLRHATFPGTELPADFSCELRQQLFAWHMTLSFTLGGFRSTVPFESWLAGIESAKAPVWLADRVCELGTMGQVELTGGAAAQFSPNWAFVFQGDRVGRLQGPSVDLSAKSVHMALLDRNTPSYITKQHSHRTLIAFDRGEQHWSLKPALHAREEGHLSVPDNAFTILHVEAWTRHDGRSAAALLAESGHETQPISFHLAGEALTRDSAPSALPLVDARYVYLSYLSKQEGRQALVAKFDHQPISLHVQGCHLSLGNPPGTPPFELVQYEDQASTLRCEPGIHQIALPLAGAITEPMEVPFGSLFTVANTQIRKKRRPLLRKKPSQESSSPSSTVPSAAKKRVSPTTSSPQNIQEAGKGMALTVAACLADFRCTLKIPGPLAVSVVRPQDLLVLKFEFRNLRLQVGQGKPPQLVPNPQQRGALGKPMLVVNFPPQHIAEEAFYETAGPVKQPTKSPDNQKNEPGGNEPLHFPIRARIAGWSRLVFAVPPQVTAIPYTLEALLDWSRYQLVVAPAAAPPPPPPRPIIFRPLAPTKPKRIPPKRFKRRQSYPSWSQPGEPYWNEVREVWQPFLRARALLTGNHSSGMFLIAQKRAAPRKSLSPQAQPGGIGSIAVKPFAVRPPTEAELKNVTAIEAPYRLFISPSTLAGWSHAFAPIVFNGRIELWHTRLGVRGKGGKVSETQDYYRTLRAIYSPDYGDTLVEGPQHFNSTNKKEPNPFRMSLDAKDRHELVHLMSNGVHATKAGGGLPALQARVMRAERFMLSSLGAWMNTRYAADSPTSALTIIEWRHHMNMARDQYVRVVYQGFLYPFGHAAALIKVTERKFEFVKSKSRVMAVLRQRMFIVVREPVREFPAAGQAILTYSQGRNFPYRKLQITSLVTPNLDDPTKPPSSIANTPPQEAFWPHVGGEDFLFHVVGEDWAGQSSEFSAPLVFVASNVATNSYTIKAVAKAYGNDSQKRNVVSLSGQNIAFAPPKPGGDTVLETASLKFGAETACNTLAIQEGFQPSPPVCQSASAHNQILFFPLIVHAEVTIPAVKQLLGTGKTVIRYYGPYSVQGFHATTNKGEVFAKLDQPVGLTFPGDKAGGLTTPNFGITGLSRKSGAIGGKLQDFAADTFKPDGFFTKAQNDTDPNELLKQAQILGSIFLGDIIKSAVPPKLVTENLPPNFPDHTKTTYTFSTQELKADPAGIFVPQNNFGKAKLTVTSTIIVRMPKGGTPPEPELSSLGTLENFKVDLFQMFILNFRKLHFEKKHNKKSEVQVQLAEPALTFGGPLSFVNSLKDILSDVLGGGPSFDVQPTGIIAGFALPIPTVSVGVFSLSNLKLSAGIVIPFTNKPVRVRFAVSERNDPFTITVWVFGGGGFFAIAIGADGVEIFEMALEFGGKFALDIGVASGGVEVMAGIYIKYTIEPNPTFNLEGYFRLGGHVSVIGLITVSVEFKLSLEYESSSGKVAGEASLIVEVEVLLFSASVTLNVRKEFAGSNQTAELPSEDYLHFVDAGIPHLTARGGRPVPQLPPPPKIQDMISEKDWLQYSSAFAA